MGGGGQGCEDCECVCVCVLCMSLTIDWRVSGGGGARGSHRCRLSDSAALTFYCKALTRQNRS